MRLLSKRLAAYYRFTSAFLGPARAVRPDRGYRTDVRTLGGMEVAILQLNSAWLAEGGEAGYANRLAEILGIK